MRARARRSVSRVLSRHFDGDGHSSGTFVAERLARPTRAAARKLARHGCPCLPLLLGLAPGGVFPAVPIAGDAVRSYRTISPLPPMVSPKGYHGVGGVFSVALSLGSPPPAVNRHRASEEPGLSSLASLQERPSDRLAMG